MSSAPQPVSAAGGGNGQAPGRMMQLRLESKPIIYASYMSFLEFGGVFMPSNSGSGRPKGVGLAFGSDESGLKAKKLFEAVLAGLLHNERPTYTM